jgi:hypothetical protein
MLYSCFVGGKKGVWGRRDGQCSSCGGEDGRYHKHCANIIAHYCFDGRHRSRCQRQTTSWRHGLATRTVAAHAQRLLDFNHHNYEDDHGSIEEP